MKLYGMPVAIIPNKDNPHLFDITCNPIYVSDKNLKTFKVLDGGEDEEGKRPKLNYTATFDPNDTEDMLKNFVRLVDTLDKVVALQTQSCANNHVKYRPVAVEMGEDARKPLNLNALYMQVFGKRLTQLETRDMLEEELFDTFGYKKKTPMIPGGDFDNQPEEIKRKVRKEIIRTGATEKQRADLEAAVKANELSQAEVEEAEKIRSEYLSRHPNMIPIFMQAYDKLQPLLEKCSLIEGNFHVIPPSDMKDPGQSELDKKIIELGKQGDLYSRLELRRIALKKGIEHGHLVTQNPYTFKIPARHPNHVTDKDAQKLHPEYLFMHDDSDCKEAYEKGFKRLYRGPYTRTLVPPLEHNPPFTSTCADRIRDQHQIVAGRRSEDGFEDSMEARLAIKRDIGKASDNLHSR